MSSLKDKANNILSDKSTNLLPENIKKDTTILGVVGTLETLDTSDANATADDIARNKTAYVNGELITGNVFSYDDEILNSDTMEIDLNQLSGDGDLPGMVITLKQSVSSKCMVTNNTKISAFKRYDEFADLIGLTPEKIKAGETILGVTGTYTGE